MHLGIQLPEFNFPMGTTAIRPTLKAIAQFVDSNGFYSLWTMDHFFQMEMLNGPQEPMLEGYATLSYFAALTEHVRLGTLVTGVIYRHPGILAKTLTTLDVLSGGRAYLGIGAAWYEREAKGLGIPYPSTSARFEMLEETLQIMHAMFAGDTQPFNGKHYQLAEPINLPAPISQPRPSIMIGGEGEKKTLRFVAQYADACNMFAYAGTDVLRQKLDVLKRHCDDVGRDYATIEKTILWSVRENHTPGDVIAHAKSLSELGFTHMIVNMSDVHTLHTLEMLAKDVVPALEAF
jgi:F420-dependent oxidoreductase-like protein